MRSFAGLALLLSARPPLVRAPATRKLVTPGLGNTVTALVVAAMVLPLALMGCASTSGPGSSTAETEGIATKSLLLRLHLKIHDIRTRPLSL